MLLHQKNAYKFWLFFLLLLIAACTCNDGRQRPDISGIQVELTVKRFEKDLFAVDTENVTQGLKELQTKYPDFYPLYIERIMQFAADADSIHTYDKVMKKFLGNKAIQGLYDTVSAKYADLSGTGEEMESAFRYFKYYFPDTPAPQEIVTFISEFAYAAFAYEDVVGIGLDMYLGADYIYYPSLGFPNYLIRKLDKKFMVPNVVKVWAQDIHPAPREGAKLIDQMIYEGINLYFMERILPDTPDSLLIGYTEEEMEWVQDNEPEIWNYFLKHDLLYSTQFQEYRKYISPGPTTPGMPPGSPGNVGSWVGWQIVRRYMDKETSITLPQLMKMYDGQEILNKSNYKPKRELL